MSPEKMCCSSSVFCTNSSTSASNRSTARRGGGAAGVGQRGPQGAPGRPSPPGAGGHPRAPSGASHLLRGFWGAPGRRVARGQPRRQPLQLWRRWWGACRRGGRPIDVWRRLSHMPGAPGAPDTLCSSPIVMSGGCLRLLRRLRPCILLWRSIQAQCLHLLLRRLLPARRGLSGGLRHADGFPRASRCSAAMKCSARMRQGGPRARVLGECHVLWRAGNWLRAGLAATALACPPPNSIRCRLPKRWHTPCPPPAQALCSSRYLQPARPPKAIHGLPAVLRLYYRTRQARQAALLLEPLAAAAAACRVQPPAAAPLHPMPSVPPSLLLMPQDIAGSGAAGWC